MPVSHRASSRYLWARSLRPRRSQIGAKSLRTVTRNQPSHTLTPAGVADAIHPIVPVSRTDERQPVRAIFHRVPNGA